MFKVTSTDKAPAAIGPYSQAIEVNGFLFASGQVPINPEVGDVVAWATSLHSTKYTLNTSQANPLVLA